MYIFLLYYRVSFTKLTFFALPALCTEPVSPYNENIPKQIKRKARCDENVLRVHPTLRYVLNMVPCACVNSLIVKVYIDILLVQNTTLGNFFKIVVHFRLHFGFVPLAQLWD